MCLAYRLDSEDSCPEQLPATVCPLQSLIRKLPFVVASPADWTHATRCHRIDSRSPIWLTKHAGCAWHRQKYSIGPIFGVFPVMRPADMTTTIMSHSYYVILVTFLHRAWVSASSRATAKLFSFTPSASMTSIDSDDDIANLSFPMRSHKSSRRKASWEYWNWDSLIISWSRGQSPNYLLDIKKQLLKWLVTRPCSLRNLRSVMLENDSWAGRLLSLCTISELIRMVMLLNQRSAHMCPQSTLPILLLLQGDHHIVLHKTLEFPMMNTAANASRGGEKRLQPTATTSPYKLIKIQCSFA